MKHTDRVEGREKNCKQRNAKYSQIDTVYRLHGAQCTQMCVCVPRETAEWRK